MYIHIYLFIFLNLFCLAGQFGLPMVHGTLETKWCYMHQFPFNYLSILLFPALVYKFTIFSEKQETSYPEANI